MLENTWVYAFPRSQKKRKRKKVRKRRYNRVLSAPLCTKDQQGHKEQQNTERKSSRYWDWRRQVFKRDNFTCRRCHESKPELEAHHIKEWLDFPALRFQVSNGLTLCIPCHNSKHQWRVNKYPKYRKGITLRRKVFTSKDYSQEQLRQLVPSLQGV